MMRASCLAILLVSMFELGSAGPVRNIDRQSERQAEEDSNRDRRLPDKLESGLGLYECTGNSQCSNGGTCVLVGKEGRICNCSKGFLGPFCRYPANKVKEVLRSHSFINASFRECMTKSRDVNISSLFDKCGSGQNLCWIKEGGLEELKCFFWCLSNTIRISLTDDKPDEDSRWNILGEMFHKLERQIPPADSSQPKVPVATFQINIYNSPSPQSTGPTIKIKPTWTYWSPESDVTSTTSPDEDATSPDTRTEEDSDYYYDYLTPFLSLGSGAPDELVHQDNVVEDSGHYEEMAYMIPFPDLISNMRG